jgi:hypothetical protein
VVQGVQPVQQDLLDAQDKVHPDWVIILLVGLVEMQEPQETQALVGRVVLAALVVQVNRPTQILMLQVLPDLVVVGQEEKVEQAPQEIIEMLLVVEVVVQV